MKINITFTNTKQYKIILKLLKETNKIYILYGEKEIQGWNLIPQPSTKSVKTDIGFKAKWRSCKEKIELSQNFLKNKKYTEFQN